MFGVFKKTASVTRDMGSIRTWTRTEELLKATMLDHLTAGSIQCLSWKSSRWFSESLRTLYCIADGFVLTATF